MLIRPATPADHLDVRRVLDAGVLQVPTDLAARTVLVAVESDTPAADGESPVLGALVVDGERITAVGVRPRRRGQGIGTALVEAAARRRARLTAQFDPSVRPFWASLGFTIEPVDGREDRLRGVRR